MYKLFLLKNESDLVVIFLKTKNECLDYIKNTGCKIYKIYEPNEERNIFFLNAFIWDEQKKDFIIDIDKAKQIKKSQLREIREMLFPKLDVAFMKAVEQDDTQTKQNIVNLKNQFREITAIDLPNEEQDLLEFMPQVFKDVYNLNV